MLIFIFSRTLLISLSMTLFHSASCSISTKGVQIMPDNDIFKLCHCRPKSKRCWRQVRRCEYRTYKTLCENVPIKTCDPKPVKECKEKCGTFYYCDNCPSVVGPPSPPPAGTFIVGPPAPPLSRTPRKTSKDVRRRQIPRGPLEMQTP